MTVCLSFFFLSTFILPGDCQGLQLYDYWSNRGAYIIKSLRVFRGTCLQFMIDCICVHSKAFYVVLHICVYCVYWWWTSSTRWSPYKARSRSELKLNLMIVTMFALSNHLFWHSFNCYVMFCMLSLFDTICVGPLYQVIWWH